MSYRRPSPKPMEDELWQSEEFPEVRHDKGNKTDQQPIPRIDHKGTLKTAVNYGDLGKGKKVTIGGQEFTRVKKQGTREEWFSPEGMDADELEKFMRDHHSEFEKLRMCRAANTSIAATSRGAGHR